MVFTKKLQNGVLEKKGDVCHLRCIQGTYAFPGKQFLCKESEFCAEARCVPVTSCKEIKKLLPIATNGVYAIFRKDGGSSYNVYCDMTTDGGGWTLAANIANGDSNNWVFGDKDRDFGDSSSLWENDMTLGTVDSATINRPLDFKSRAFIEVDARELLISYKGQYEANKIPSTTLLVFFIRLANENEIIFNPNKLQSFSASSDMISKNL